MMQAAGDTQHSTVTGPAVMAEKQLAEFDPLGYGELVIEYESHRHSFQQGRCFPAATTAAAAAAGVGPVIAAFSPLKEVVDDVAGVVSRDPPELPEVTQMNQSTRRQRVAADAAAQHAAGDKQQRIAPETREFLLQMFRKNPMPDVTEREHMSAVTGVATQRLRNWFQNRRSHLRRMHKRKETAAAASNMAAPDSDSNLPHIDSLLKHRSSAKMVPKSSHQSSGRKKDVRAASLSYVPVPDYNMNFPDPFDAPAPPSAEQVQDQQFTSLTSGNNDHHSVVPMQPVGIMSGNYHQAPPGFFPMLPAGMRFPWLHPVHMFPPHPWFGGFPLPLQRFPSPDQPNMPGFLFPPDVNHRLMSSGFHMVRMGFEPTPQAPQQALDMSQQFQFEDRHPSMYADVDRSAQSALGHPSEVLDYGVVGNRGMHTQNRGLPPIPSSGAVVMNESRDPTSFTVQLPQWYSAPSAFP